MSVRRRRVVIVDDQPAFPVGRPARSSRMPGTPRRARRIALRRLRRSLSDPPRARGLRCARWDRERLRRRRALTRADSSLAGAVGVHRAGIRPAGASRSLRRPTPGVTGQLVQRTELLSALGRCSRERVAGATGSRSSRAGAWYRQARDAARVRPVRRRADGGVVAPDRRPAAVPAIADRHGCEHPRLAGAVSQPTGATASGLDPQVWALGL